MNLTKVKVFGVYRSTSEFINIDAYIHNETNVTITNTPNMVFSILSVLYEPLIAQDIIPLDIIGVYNKDNTVLWMEPEPDFQVDKLDMT